VDPRATEGDPVCLDLADALELYAAILHAPSRQAADQLRPTAPRETAPALADP